MANSKSFSYNQTGSIQDGTTSLSLSPDPRIIDTSHTYNRYDFACSILGDHTLLLLARWREMTPGGLARKHLNHYLEGTGFVLFVDIQKLWDDDSGVRNKLRAEVALSLGAKPSKVSGTIPIPQSTYKNQDWQYALGSINMNWYLAPGFTQPPSANNVSQIEIVFSFQNEYRWHPEDASRPSQCLHRAAERLKSQIGANDYWMVGDPTHIVFPL